jgi:hypothetical protein
MFLIMRFLIWSFLHNCQILKSVYIFYSINLLSSLIYLIRMIFACEFVKGTMILNSVNCFIMLLFLLYSFVSTPDGGYQLKMHHSIQVARLFLLLAFLIAKINGLHCDISIHSYGMHRFTSIHSSILPSKMLYYLHSFPLES